MSKCETTVCSDTGCVPGQSACLPEANPLGFIPVPFTGGCGSCGSQSPSDWTIVQTYPPTPTFIDSGNKTSYKIQDVVTYSVSYKGSGAAPNCVLLLIQGTGGASGYAAQGLPNVQASLGPNTTVAYNGTSGPNAVYFIGSSFYQSVPVSSGGGQITLPLTVTMTTSSAGNGNISGGFTVTVVTQ